MLDYFGHSQTNEFLRSFKMKPADNRTNPPPGLYPPGLTKPPKRRLKAFRVPEVYTYDQIRGYQLDADTFKIYRIRPGLIPVDAKVDRIVYDHLKRETFVCIEHPSFPECAPGKLVEEIPIELEEIEVARASYVAKQVEDATTNVNRLADIINGATTALPVTMAPGVRYRGYGQTQRDHLELKESLGNLSEGEAVRLKNMRQADGRFEDELSLKSRALLNRALARGVKL